MRWVMGKDMLNKARGEGYAVGAFSAHNAETIQAIIAAAAEEKAPIMIQVGQKVIKYMGMKQMADMIRSFGEGVDAEVAIHLDHGNSYEQAVEAIQLSFQSVMYDGSHHPIEKNIEISRDVVKAAHAVGISVEGELGRIGGTEDDITVRDEDAFLTDVEDAIQYTRGTGIDSLAVAIGTAHGLYKGEPKLNFERLKEISEHISIPLVLHGGSGVPDDLIRKAIPLGVAKINVDTELRQAFTQGAQAIWEQNPNEFVLANVLGNAREHVKQRVIEKIRLFGSSGKSSKA
jgi:fructose-bisphosphate aldolase class II